MNHLSPNVVQKLKSFLRWMTHEDRPYELHDDFLNTLTRDNYLKFRHMDSQSFSASSPCHHDPYKLKTSFSGESKHQTPSKSTPAPQKVHQHSQDEPTEEPTPETSTQTLVNKCLAESGIDPTDIYLQGSINPNTTIVMTWIPLTHQVQYKLLSKLPVMTHTTPSVLIA